MIAADFRRTTASRRTGRPLPFAAAPLALLLAGAVLAGCSKNPVTGKKEFAPYSTRDEINLGKQHYGPLQQAQGGRFKTDPKLAAYVRRVGRRVAKASDRTKLPYEFVVINNSVPNAWALPGGKIAVNRGLLLEMENEAELAAVLSHEVVHAAARHGGQALTRNLLFGVAQIAIALTGRKSQHINYILGGTGLAFQLINRGYSRGAEREADFFGMKYMHRAGYDTRAAVSLQQKFLALSKGRRQNWLTGLFATHPPSKERVKNNRKALKKFTPGGDLGRKRYDRQLAWLRARRPAYAAADKARRVMTAAPASALPLIETAIARVPDEAQFRGLKGQILARLGRYRSAVGAYNAAIRRDPGFYEHYLGRGLAQSALGNSAGSQSDLRYSYHLLPTSLAGYALGNLRLESGDSAGAKTLFAAAAGARGDVGEAARARHAMLDIADNPGRYVTARPVFRFRRLLVRVSNRTGYRLTGITVSLSGKVGNRPIWNRLQLHGLGAHGSFELDSGVTVGPKESAKADARVVRARISADLRPLRRYYP